MAVREVQLFDDSVKTRTIAPDVIIPADIDETAAFNFSSASGTFGNVKATLKAQGLEVSVVEGSTNTNFNWSGSFAGVPIVSIGETSSTVNQRVSVVPTVGGGTLRATAAAASTYNIVGVYGY